MWGVGGRGGRGVYDPEDLIIRFRPAYEILGEACSLCLDVEACMRTEGGGMGGGGGGGQERWNVLAMVHDPEDRSAGSIQPTNSYWRLVLPI